MFVNFYKNCIKKKTIGKFSNGKVHIFGMISGGLTGYSAKSLSGATLF